MSETTLPQDETENDQTETSPKESEEEVLKEKSENVSLEEPKEEKDEEKDEEKEEERETSEENIKQEEEVEKVSGEKEEPPRSVITEEFDEVREPEEETKIDGLTEDEEPGHKNDYFYCPGESYPNESEPEEEILFPEASDESTYSSEDYTTQDSEYLKKVLGIPLTYAILDIVNKRPTDPIQYLARWLIKWRWKNDNKKNFETKIKELELQREEKMLKAQEKIREKMLANERMEEQRKRMMGKNESSMASEAEFSEM